MVLPFHLNLAQGPGPEQAVVPVVVAAEVEEPAGAEVVVAVAVVVEVAESDKLAW